MIVRKSITIGGQYLVAVVAGDHLFKAKVPASVGQSLSGAIWIDLPISRITLFTEDGHRAGLVPAVESVSPSAS